MNLTVHIPDDLAGRLSAGGGDLSRRALEALAAEEYKRGRLTKPELQRLLGIGTGSELEAFLEANDAQHPGFDAGKAREAGARIREIRRGVRLERQAISIRELAHLGHKY